MTPAFEICLCVGPIKASDDWLWRSLLEFSYDLPWEACRMQSINILLCESLGVQLENETT